MKLGPCLATLCLIFTIIAGSIPLQEIAAWEEAMGSASPGVQTPDQTPPADPDDGILADALPTDWFYPYVQFGYQHGFLTGADRGFEPWRTVTRAELITMLGRVHVALGGELLGEDAPPLLYTDVAENAFYIPYLTWATERGIVQGDFEGHFRPNDPLTREALALILVRYVDSYGLYHYLWPHFEERGTYGDNDLISTWARREAHLLRNWGFMHGSPGENPQPGVYFFRPGDPALRAEAAVILVRLFGAAEEHPYD